MFVLVRTQGNASNQRMKGKKQIHERAMELEWGKVGEMGMKAQAVRKPREQTSGRDIIFFWSGRPLDKTAHASRCLLAGVLRTGPDLARRVFEGDGMGTSKWTWVSSAYSAAGLEVWPPFWGCNQSADRYIW